MLDLPWWLEGFGLGLVYCSELHGLHERLQPLRRCSLHRLFKALVRALLCTIFACCSSSKFGLGVCPVLGPKARQIEKVRKPTVFDFNPTAQSNADGLHA